MALNEPDWEYFRQITKTPFSEWLFNRSITDSKDFIRGLWERGFGYQMLLIYSGSVLLFLPVVFLLNKYSKEDK